MNSTSDCAVSILNTASFPPYMIGELTLLLRESGIETTRWLAELGIEGDEVFFPVTRLSYSQIRHLVRRAIAITGDQALGLKVGLRQNTRSLGALGLVLLTSPTIRDVLNLSLQHSPEAGALVNAKAVFSVKDFTLLVEPIFGSDDIYPFLVEEVFASCLSVVRDIVGNQFAYKRIDFSYPRPTSVDLYHRIFACPMKFGAAVSCAVIDADWLEKKIPGSNPVSFHLAMSAFEAFRAANKVVHRDHTEVAVERILRRNIHANVSMEDVAAMLHLSVRTLRRRLDERGTTFRAIADRVHRTTAHELLLKGEHSIAEIGDQLGFSDVRSFRRAFEQWYGVSPAKWIKEQRAARNED